MSDTTITTPTNTPTTPETLNQKISALFSSFKTKINSDAKLLWANDKLFLVIFGVIIFLAKGSSLLISFLAYGAKQEVNSATKQSDKLQSQENAANEQANELVNDSNKLANQSTNVDSNWDKK